MDTDAKGDSVVNRGRWRGVVVSVLASAVVAGVVVGAAPPSHAAFPGTNGPVVFVDSSGNINVIDPTTGVVSQICPSAACGSPRSQERTGTSPNGQTVVFANATGLATVSIAGGGFTQLTGTGEGDADPSYTADGSTIVYRTGGSTLAKVPATGGASTTISGPPAGCVDEPEVSPDGSTVVFINTCTQGRDLDTVPVAGGLTNLLVADPGFDEQPSWSPDGTKVAFVDLNHCPETTPIALVAATANNALPTCMPNSRSGDNDPSFSPDGTEIAVAGCSPGGGGEGLAIKQQGEGGGGCPFFFTTALSILGANGIGRTDFSTTTDFLDNYWGPAAPSTTTTTTAGGTTTTTTSTTPCFGTLNGTAYKGGSAKPRKALAGVIVAAGSASSDTNGAGAYSMTVPCGPVTKTATGPATRTRVCHFGSASGPTSVSVTVTNGSTDTENLFCKKK